MRPYFALLLAAAAGVACAQPLEWAAISPAAAGLDAAKLESWRAALAAHGTTGLIVVRRGRIAFEWYAPGWNAERQHGTASMAKALVGGMSLAVAMSEGRISPDDLASKYIAPWRADPLKSKITIRQLATHTSGIEDAEQDDIAHDRLPGWKGDFWKRTPDPFSIAVQKASVLFAPGTQNAYSNPGMAALSYAITASLQGGDVRTLLKQRVLDPLGIPERDWSIGYGRAYEVDGLKLYANWGGGSFTARATARIAQLMLLRGQWNGRELIHRDVVKRVLTDQGMPHPARSATNPAPASGLAWYTNSDGIWPAAPRDTFAGAGASHQVVFASPSLDLIVVRNGDLLGDTKPGFWGPVYDLLMKPLMEAVTITAPYPPSPVVRGAVFGKEIRRAAIDSDNWPLTWAADDAQYTSYGDGYGFEPHVESKLGMGFARITGDAGSFHGENLRSDAERTGGGAKSPKASGILAVEGVLYLWVRNVGNAQLLYSRDSGRTWTWGFKMDTAFGSPAFLNFGRDYAGARDSYVYTYSQNGPSAYESDNGVLLARVPKDRIRDRAAWEFYAGVDDAGHPLWTLDIARRADVFVYPANAERVDVVYDAGIHRYLVALGYDHNGGWGLFDAPEPWGPWTTILHRNWDVPDTHGYRLPAKWISPDGLTLTLVFSGLKPNDAFCTRTLTLQRSESRTPTREALVYGEADGVPLTMDYYAPKRHGPHPIAIIIHGGGYQRGDSKSGSEAYCADFLAPAGYAVFSANYRLAPKYPYPYMVYDVQRAIRYLRHNASQWDADPRKIVLVGGSAGGFLSNMAGLRGAPGDPRAADPVDRENAGVQAVVTLFAQSSFATVPLNADVHALLDPLIQQKGAAAALREASPITYVTNSAPPFLQILGDKDEYIPFTEATNLDSALRAVGVASEIIRIPNGAHGTGGWHRLPGVPDWERRMVAWLNAALQHQGPIGEGIRPRL